MRRALNGYATTLEPWAKAVASRFVWDVSRRNEDAWVALSKTMGSELRKEIYEAPIGQVMQKLMYDQVGLIKSLPTEAALRVQQLAVGSLEFSSRGEDIIKMIMQTGHVTRNRAIMIARTETSRASSVLTEARALHVGSEGYTWETAGDENVRESHKKMQGRLIMWNAPPEVEPGKFYHAGCIYNCRCFADPIIPDKFK
jgi:SPP1 gp7 family putative phage head morphogenesis protein